MSLRSRSRWPGSGRSVLAWRSSIKRRMPVLSPSSLRLSRTTLASVARKPYIAAAMLDPTSPKNAAATEIYGDSWYAATMVDAPRRPALYSDLDIDVCVIGGGLAGLTTARELARAGWSVVLLEANRLAAGASGRNTGFVLPGFACDADKIIARVGFERAKSLWALSQAGVDYVRNAIRDEAAIGNAPQD